MSNGNMAIPVSPMTEDEMNTFASLLSKAANAIVNSSTMPKTIADLTAKVESLQSELERKSLHATELDNSLHDMRTSRDDTINKLMALQKEHDWTVNDFNRVSRERDSSVALNQDRLNAIMELNAQVETLKRERDDNGFHALELQEKLDTVQARMAELFGLVKPTATPEPKAEPISNEPIAQSAVELPQISEAPKYEDQPKANEPSLDPWQEPETKRYW